MRKIDGAVQFVLAVALIVAIVYGCKPASSDVDAGDHNPATCRVCRAPKLLGEGSAEHDLPLIAAQHLRTCVRCKGAGYTLADAMAVGQATPCLVGYDTTQATHSDSETR